MRNLRTHKHTHDVMVGLFSEQTFYCVYYLFEVTNGLGEKHATRTRTFRNLEPTTKYVREKESRKRQAVYMRIPPSQPSLHTNQYHRKGHSTIIMTSWIQKFLYFPQNPPLNPKNSPDQSIYSNQAPLIPNPSCSSSPSSSTPSHAHRASPCSPTSPILPSLTREKSHTFSAFSARREFGGVYLYNIHPTAWILYFDLGGPSVVIRAC